jgi:hypothetical protein
VGSDSEVPFSHIKYSPYSPEGSSTLFLGTESGKLYKITNAESTAETVEIGSPDFPTAYLSCVAVGANEDNLLVTFSNYGVSSVWLTDDGGETWREKENNLPDMPIRWALFHPDNNGQVLLATEIGVWATNTLYEDETKWAPAVDGLANVRVDMLKLRKADNTVLAATHGRGLAYAIYDVDIYVGEKELEAGGRHLKISPNPASVKTLVSFELNQPETVSVVLTNLSGEIVFRESVFAPEGHFSKEINLQGLSRGMNLLGVQSEHKQSTTKLIID